MALFFGTVSAAAPTGLQISPVTLKFDVKPGETVTDKINLKNLNTEPLNYILETENFTQVSDEGAPSFDGATKEGGVTTLADWFTFPVKEGILAPNESKSFDFTISVPATAEPGGHYAAVFAKQITKNAEGQVELGVASRVGTLILVSVPGDVKKTAEISELKLPKFVWKGPVGVSIKVANTGSIHYDSKASFEFTSLFGQKSQAEFAINPATKLAEDTHTILPKNSRLYEATWQKKYPIGRYNVVASATDGDSQTMTKNGVVWAIPLIIIVPIILFLIILFLIIRYFKKHLRFVPAAPADPKV